MLDNHDGMVIGGLIKEVDRTDMCKLPWLGDLKYIGKIFQNRQIQRSRSEIIVTLVPHIVEPGCQTVAECTDCMEETMKYERTATPLLYGPLQRTCRPWEPRLSDSVGADRHMDVNRVNGMLP